MELTACQRIKCPLIKDVLEVIENGKCEKPISCVFIQCGTNNLDHEDVDSVSYHLSNVIDKVKQNFKEAKIVISSILPRRDKNNEIERLNKFLANVCDVARRVKFMENLEINEEMLQDRKHLNDLGFKNYYPIYDITFSVKCPSSAKRLLDTVIIRNEIIYLVPLAKEVVLIRDVIIHLVYLEKEVVKYVNNGNGC